MFNNQIVSQKILTSVSYKNLRVTFSIYQPQPKMEISKLFKRHKILILKVSKTNEHKVENQMELLQQREIEEELLKKAAQIFLEM